MDREFMRAFYREFREHAYDEAVKDSDEYKEMRDPKINRVRTIADALEIPYPWLLGMEGDEYRKRMLADFTTEEILAEMKRRIESNCAKKTRKQEDKKRDLTR